MKKFSMHISVENGGLKHRTMENLQNEIVKKWRGGLIAGFVSIPNLLFRYQWRLGIKNSELVVLLNIVLHWWNEDKLPSPGIPTIAKRMGVNRRTVERSVEKLEQKGLIRRIKRNDGSGQPFDLSGLVNQLRQIGKQYSETGPQSMEQFEQYEKSVEQTN